MKIKYLILLLLNITIARAQQIHLQGALLMHKLSSQLLVLPDEELSKDIIIVSAKQNNTWFDVDISAYCIQNPDNGFFVAFGMLNHEYYNLKKGAEATNEFGQPWETIDSLGVHHVFGARNTADVITPRLGVTLTELKEPRSYFSCTSLQNMSWHWEKDYFDRRYLIRATIAPE